MEAMEILGCGASRAGWSVMLSGYMEWNSDPNLIKKDVTICFRIPHAGLATHTRGASYSRGGILLNVSVFSGNMVLFGFEEEQRNPDLAQFADAEAEPPAKRVKKIS